MFITHSHCGKVDDKDQQQHTHKRISRANEKFKLHFNKGKQKDKGEKRLHFYLCTRAVIKNSSWLSKKLGAAEKEKTRMKNIGENTMVAEKASVFCECKSVSNKQCQEKIVRFLCVPRYCCCLVFFSSHSPLSLTDILCLLKS